MTIFLMDSSGCTIGYPFCSKLLINGLRIAICLKIANREECFHMKDHNELLLFLLIIIVVVDNDVTKEPVLTLF